MSKLNDDRNKAYMHITEEAESFIYQKGIINDYSIETMQDVDCFSVCWVV